MAWIKVQSDIFDHPKVVKATRRLTSGDMQIVASLISLWGWVHRNKPDGNLGFLDSEAIAIAARWDGDADKFVEVLIEVGLLDRDEEGALFVHDWEEHNEKLKKAKWKRAERARKKTSLHVESCRATSPDVAPEMRGDERRGDENIFISSSYEDSLELVPHSSSVQKPLAKETVKTVNGVSSDLVDQVIGHYQAYFPRRKPGAKERRLIASRIKEEKRTPRELCEAIDGMMISPWHQGQNKHGKKYDSLELVVRDAKHVDDFISLAREGPPQKPVSEMSTSEFISAVREENQNRERRRSNEADAFDSWALPSPGDEGGGFSVGGFIDAEAVQL